MGTSIFKKKLKKVGYDKPSEMLKRIVETGKVRLWACTTTMELMGVKEEDLRTDLVTDFATVGKYCYVTKDADIALFI